MAEIEIIPRPVDHPDALAMIAGSEAELASIYAPEHRYAFSPDELIAAHVHFVVVCRGGSPIGCGGMAPLDGYGELKRIFTDPAARGTGIGRRIVAVLEAEAKGRALPLMRLETGEASPDALALYEKCGYRRIGPFGSYRDNGSSVFMEKAL
ncbi:MAG: GNAT family N-acetyltransferase [Pseudomonadota bacterium]